MKKHFLLSCLIAPLFCFGTTAENLAEDQSNTHSEESTTPHQLTVYQRNAITEIVSIFYEGTSEELLAQTESLMPKLMSLMEISPFDLMGHILEDNDMKMKMSEGLRDPAKGSLFVQGFGFRMMQEIIKTRFSEELSEFCTRFHLKPTVLQSFVSKNDWTRFLLYSFKGSMTR